MNVFRHPIILNPFLHASAAFSSSLGSPAGNGISIDTFSNGQITITAAAVPEPSSRLPLLAGIVLVTVATVKRKLSRCT